ncbi:unnamed protein product [Cochlearia groenlandica]
MVEELRIVDTSSMVDELCRVETFAINAKNKEVENLKDEEAKYLRRKNEHMQVDYDFFLGGSAVKTRWKMVKEYLNGKHLAWILEGLDRRYAKVVKAQTQFKGLPAPEVVDSLVALNNGPPS